MGGMAMFGGGWAFQNFTETNTWEVNMIAGNPGFTWSAWNAFELDSPAARWIELKFYKNGDVNSQYLIQIGQGPFGFETLLYPSGGALKSFQAYFNTVDSQDNQWSYSFPTSLKSHTILSWRLQCPIGNSPLRMFACLYG